VNRGGVRWALVLFALGLLVLLHVLDVGRYLSLAAVKASQADLEAWRASRPLLAGLIFFAGYIALTAASIPGAAAATLAAGAIFGFGWGTLIVSFAASIGATLAFLASRWLLGDWVRQRFGTRMATVDAGVAREGGFYLFSLRLVPVIPFVAINLAMGLTAMRPWTFYWVSQLGMLAGTLVFVNAGTQLAGIDSMAGIVSPGLAGSLALLGIFPLLARRVLDRVRTRRIYARWQRPAIFDRNLVVIGGGSAGLVTAYIAAALRAKVTLVEKHRMGGDCLNTGCVPSKALIRSAALLSQIARSPDFGIRAARVDFDFADVMERVQRIVAQVEPHDSVERYRRLGVEVAEGTARIVSPWIVDITERGGCVRRLRTRSIVIAAGARPYVPPIPGIERVDVLTSDTVWALRVRPRRMLVLGGGPIGCEFSQAFARLGCTMTLVESAQRLLAREDPEVSELVVARFRSEGIDVRLGHVAIRIEVESGEAVLIANHDGGEARLPFDALLLAVGRTANLTGYGLQDLGVTAGRTVEVNGFLQTNYPNIYAAGDVAGPFQFTHAAAHQAWYAAINALFDPFKTFRADYRVMPWVTFVDPELARVGINELEARERGIPFEVTRYPMRELDRAIADGETHGFVKILTEPGRDRILGVTIVGAHAADLLAEYVLAMKHRIGLDRILGTIHAYPTMAEANKQAAGQWKRAHLPERALAWLARFHAWRRCDGLVASLRSDPGAVPPDRSPRALPRNDQTTVR